MVRPSEDTPNGGTHVLAVRAPLGQLNYFVALALQQHGEQSALRKGRGHNVVSFCFSCPKDGQFSQGFRSFLRQVPYKSRRAFAREGHTPRTRVLTRAKSPPNRRSPSATSTRVSPWCTALIIPPSARDSERAVRKRSIKPVRIKKTFCRWMFLSLL